MLFYHALLRELLLGLRSILMTLFVTYIPVAQALMPPTLHFKGYQTSAYFLGKATSLYGVAFTYPMTPSEPTAPLPVNDSIMMCRADSI